MNTICAITYVYVNLKFKLLRYKVSRTSVRCFDSDKSMYTHSKGTYIYILSTTSISPSILSATRLFFYRLLLCQQFVPRISKQYNNYSITEYDNILLSPDRTTICGSLAVGSETARRPPFCIDRTISIGELFGVHRNIHTREKDRGRPLNLHELLHYCGIPIPKPTFS